MDVTLPSGLRLRGLLPTLNTLARRGLLTSDLYDAVLQAEAKPEWLVSAPSDGADAETKRRLWFALSAAFPRERWEAGVWVPWTLTTLEFEDLVVEEDKDALLALVMRAQTADEITQESLEILGSEPATADEEVPAETPSAWEPFRDDLGGDADREDGGSVADDAEQPAPDPGRGDGVPGGRGAGDAPVGGGDASPQGGGAEG